MMFSNFENKFGIVSVELGSSTEKRAAQLDSGV